MKNYKAVILITEIAAGLLLLFALWERNGDRTLQVMSGEINPYISEKKVALTFDDGPHPEYTPVLLQGLKERGVRATFFVVGQQAKDNPELIKQMEEDGHLVGNHTYTHLQLTKENHTKYREELLQTDEVLQEILGHGTAFVRPPYGSWDKSLEKELALFPVLWTVDPNDWCRTDASGICRCVVSKVKENDIILLHDYYGSSVEAALEIVDCLTDRGYTFVTVDELLFE